MHDTVVVSNLPGANVCNATSKYCIPPLGDTFGVGRCDRLLIYRSLRLVLFGASGRSTNTQTRCLSPEISPEKIAPSEEYIYRTFVYFNSISVSLYFIYIKLYRIILFSWRKEDREERNHHAVPIADASSASSLRRLARDRARSRGLSTGCRRRADLGV